MRKGTVAVGLLVIVLAFALGCSQDAPAATPTGTSMVMPSATSTAVPTADGLPVRQIADAPARDPLDLARRYKGVDAAPLGPGQLYPTETVGAVRTFNVLVGAGPAFREATAELRLVGEHALWYVESGEAVAQDDLERAALAFDEEVYPHVVGNFSSSAPPAGRITVLNAGLSLVAGYFTAVDHLPSAVDSVSNERVMLYLSTSAQVGSARYMGTLAHELQHLVHALVDADEETWVQEGLSEFAARSGGYPALPQSAYLREPGTSLTRWPEQIQDALPNYAGASLFVDYLMTRAGGPSAAERLVSERANGVAGVQAFLDEAMEGVRFEDVLADWMVANLVGAGSLPYGYPGLVGTVAVDVRLREPGVVMGSVPQFGAWYAAIEPDASLRVTFRGEPATLLLPEPPPSGVSCWWSNRGDNIDSTLTRSLDLTTVERATLEFSQWYALEEGYDYGYVAVSTDGGASWEALAGRHTTLEDPGLRSLGPGYTGRSGGWVRERIDLTPFAGSRVLLRFEHVADESINGAGWCVDDVTIAEVGFSDDAESDGDWAAAGFVRLPEHGVAQRFVARLVRGSGDDATVEVLELDAGLSFTFTVDRPAVLLVTAIAPKTSEPARFTLEVSLAP